MQMEQKIRQLCFEKIFTTEFNGLNKTTKHLLERVLKVMEFNFLWDG
jgi:hypothetical protein